MTSPLRVKRAVLVLIGVALFSGGALACQTGKSTEASPSASDPSATGSGTTGSVAVSISRDDSKPIDPVARVQQHQPLSSLSSRRTARSTATSERSQGPTGSRGTPTDRSPCACPTTRAPAGRRSTTPACTTQAARTTCGRANTTSTAARWTGSITALDRVKACTTEPDERRSASRALADNARRCARRDGVSHRAEIPNYWAYASRYMLQDQMFAPTDSWTLPSHLYPDSAWSAKCTDLTTPDPDASSCIDQHRPSRLGGGRAVRRRPRTVPYRWADITVAARTSTSVPWAYYVGQDTCLQQPCPTGPGRKTRRAR